jgi:hypothetical protein
MIYSHGECSICHERNDFLIPLQGEQGGPQCCLMCRGKWHAEHGKRRRLGRIVIRAMNAFLDGGGSWKDIDKLKLSTEMKLPGTNFIIQDALDPLG